MRSPAKRRIMIDLYETNLTSDILSEFAEHISRMCDRISKLSIAGNPKTIKSVRKVLVRYKILSLGQMYFCEDMEDGKTWLVSE